MKNKTGKIVLMGSGELTSSMVEVHKEMLGGGVEKKGYFLDTPAGFQPNVEDISHKALSYFANSVQHSIEIASYTANDKQESYQTQLLCQKISAADYLLVGPGSPTYFVRQINNSSLLNAIKTMVAHGGVLVAASAAALTLGTHTLPVYEIYKVGMDLYWEDGLAVLSQFGLDVVVIPHWNNAEGGTHDTKFCYMGKERYDILKTMLPSDRIIIGLDEHTACIIDIMNSICHVRGQGKITLQQGDVETLYESGENFPLELLTEGLQSNPEITGKFFSRSEQTGENERDDDFWVTIRKFQSSFQNFLELKEYTKAINVILGFDDLIHTTILVSGSDEDLSQSREILRELYVILGTEVERELKISAHFKILLQELVELRTRLKDEKEWVVADKIRDLLGKTGIRLEDGKSSTSWKFEDAG